MASEDLTVKESMTLTCSILACFFGGVQVKAVSTLRLVLFCLSYEDDDDALHQSVRVDARTQKQR